jgi:hypothetical protein
MPTLPSVFNLIRPRISSASAPAPRLPGLAGIILQLVFLDPDFRFRKQIEAVGVIPMNVADDHVGDVLGLQTYLFQGLGRLDEIRWMPTADEFVAIESAIEKNVFAGAFDQPDVHGDVHFAIFIGARDEAGDCEILESGVTDSVHFIILRRERYCECQNR